MIVPERTRRWPSVMPAAARQALLPALLEGAWLRFLALAWQGATHGQRAPAWWLLIACSGIVLMLARLPGSGDQPVDRIVGVAAGLGCIAAITGLPPDPPWFVLGLLLVWRARRLGAVPFLEERLRSSVRTGIVGFVLALLLRLLSGAVPASVAQGQVAAAVVFFILALVALAAAQFADIAQLDDTPPSEGTGAALAAGGIMLIVAVAALLAIVVPLVAPLVFWLLGRLLDLVGRLLAPLFEAFAYLIFLVLGPLLDWLQRQGLRVPRVRTGLAPRQVPSRSTGPPTHVPAFVTLLPTVLLIAIVLIVLTIVVARLAAPRMHVAADAARPADRRTSLWSWRFLGDWLHRGRRLQLPRSLALGRRNREVAVLFTARGVYRALLAKTALPGYPVELGVRPRANSQTAAEYCSAVAAALPSVADDLQRLAGWYADERYGGLGSPPVTTLETHWRRVAGALDAARTAESSRAAGPWPRR